MTCICYRSVFSALEKTSNRVYDIILAQSRCDRRATVASAARKNPSNSTYPLQTKPDCSAKPGAYQIKQLENARTCSGRREDRRNRRKKGFQKKIIERGAECQCQRQCEKQCGRTERARVRKREFESSLQLVTDFRSQTIGLSIRANSINRIH